MKTFKKLLPILLILVILACSLAIPTSADEVTTIYVAENGSAENDGTTKEKPVTIDKALELSRAAEGATVISFAEGEYKMTETITLTEADNDTVFVAEGEVSFKGGTDIPYSSFNQVTDDAILNRLVDATAKSNLKYVDLAVLNITPGNLKPNGFGFEAAATGFAPTLTYNDELLTLGQYPNDGYLHTSSTTAEAITDDAEKTIGYTATFTVSDDNRHTNWSAATDIWARGYYAQDWADTTNSVTLSSGTFTTVTNTYSIEDGRRVKFFNLLEEIDVAGEYYVDTTANKLYMLLPEGFTDGESLTYSAYDRTFFNITGASNIHFVGFNFEGTTNKGVVVEKSNYINFNDCEFSAIGDTALTYDECRNSTVENSYFHDLGSTGVLIIDCGDRKKLIQGGMKIANSRFESFSQYARTYSPAVNLSNDVGSVVSHCEFSDASNMAVRYSSNDTLIEYCEFFNCCNDTSDAGVIYAGRRYDTWGNVIRYNYFHDIVLMSDNPTNSHVQAVYLDDCSSQTSVYGNIFDNCYRAALYGGGRSNTFENNLIINNTMSNSFEIDQRGTNLSTDGTYKAMINARANSTSMLYPANDVDNTATYLAKYPAIQSLITDMQAYDNNGSTDLGKPKKNVVTTNALINSTGMKIADKVTENADSGEINAVTSNQFASVDGFVKTNDGGFDFSSSANYKTIAETVTGFEAIPFSRIGQKAYTAELPDFVRGDELDVYLTVRFDNEGNYLIASVLTNMPCGAIQGKLTYTGNLTLDKEKSSVVAATSEDWKADETTKTISFVTATDKPFEGGGDTCWADFYFTLSPDNTADVTFKLTGVQVCEIDETLTESGLDVGDKTITFSNDDLKTLGAQFRDDKNKEALRFGSKIIREFKDGKTILDTGKTAVRCGYIVAFDHNLVNSAELKFTGTDERGFPLDNTLPSGAVNIQVTKCYENQADYLIYTIAITGFNPDQTVTVMGQTKKVVDLPISAVPYVVCDGETEGTYEIIYGDRVSKSYSEVKAELDLLDSSSTYNQ